MWRENEETAIHIGLSLKEYWDLNPKQFQKYLNVYKSKKEQELQEKDYLNYLLGQYISYSFNNPKKYPSKPFLQKIQQKREMTDEEMERVAMRWG